MDALRIAKTDDTPEIIFDKSKNIFQMSGRSLPEDSVDFYTPVFQWLKQYANEPNSTTEFVFNIEYANTASSKMIQDILVALEKIEGTTIIWNYLNGDEDMESMGHELSELVKIPFKYKTYS
jgi:hypothetical protein